MQLARRSQNTLTLWTHLQREPHQPSSLPKEPRTHSLPGCIFRGSLISYPACQKKREHTHFLDIFSERARRSQNTLTPWKHFQKEFHKPSSLPEEARTHLLSGHIFQGSLISTPNCQQKPWHTYILDIFLVQSSAFQVARRSQNTLTLWRYFRNHISHQTCQKNLQYTHFLDTFLKQFSCQKSLNILTSWNHYFMLLSVLHRNQYSSFIPPALLYQNMLHSDYLHSHRGLLQTISHTLIIWLQYYSHTIKRIVSQSYLLPSENQYLTF